MFRFAQHDSAIYGMSSSHCSQCLRYKLKKISNNLLTLVAQCAGSRPRGAVTELDEASAGDWSLVMEWAWVLQWPWQLQSAWPWRLVSASA